MLLHEVLTPENVPIRYRVAGLGSRFLAWLMDSGLIVLLGFAGLLVLVILENVREGIGSAVFLVWLFFLVWGYFLLFEWLWHGQTPGKRLLGIRVINLRGTSIGFIQSAVRNVLRVIDAFPPLGFIPVLYGLGFLVAACNRENRRLGDLAAGTLVVLVDRKAKPIRPLHEESVATLLPQEALIRQRLAQFDRSQKQVILDLCLRRDQLNLADRARLFRMVAECLQSRVGLAPEEFQSDEKFVLQLATMLNQRPVAASPRSLARTLNN